MGRNYFSKHGGPYFINDGFTRHGINSSEKDNKSEQKVFYTLTIVLVSVILFVGSIFLFVF